MGMRGPTKKPTALRLLEGNPSGRALPPAELKPERLRALTPPDWLTDTGKSIWFRLAPMLDRLGLLTEADTEVLARYCDMAEKWRSARDFITQHGMVYPVKGPMFTGYDDKGKRTYKVDALKFMCAWPQVAIYRGLHNELTRIEKTFGMDPSARASLFMTGRGDDDGDDDPFAV